MNPESKISCKFRYIKSVKTQGRSVPSEFFTGDWLKR